MRLFWRVIFGLFAMSGCLVPAPVRAATADVFRLNLTLYGIIQSGPASNSTLEKVKIRAEDLVNLAEGNMLGTPVPRNQLLAFANDCLTNLRLIVYDSNAASNLVAIGQAVDLSTALSSRRKYEETIQEFSINDTTLGGARSNGIVGGGFYFHGKVNINSNFCPTSYGGQLVGVLRTMFPYVATNIVCTNFIESCTLTKCVTNCLPDCVVNCKTNCKSRSDCTTNIFSSTELIDVIVPRSPLSTGAKIGTLIEP
jgi:hypothetical protein